MRPLITIIVPYYKGLQYLELAIESIIGQKSSDWLAVIVDDCGGEDAEELVASFNDSRISYYRNEQNLGIGGNWNRGISLADTDLVSIFHSDDLLLPNYVESITQLMERYPSATMGHCATEIIDERGQPKFSLPDYVKNFLKPRSVNGITLVGGDEGLSSLARGAWIFCPTICYRKSQLPDIYFSETLQFTLDVDFTARMLLQGHVIVGTSEVAYQYRRHSQNQTQKLTENDQRFCEEIAHLNRVNAWSKQISWKRSIKTSRRMTIVRMHLLYEAIRSLIKTKVKRSIKLTLAAVSKRSTFLNCEH